MEVTLNLEEQQMKDLEQNLITFLNNLTIEQKIDLLKSYMNNKLDSLLLKTEKNRWGDNNKELTELGELIFGELSDKLTEVLTTQIINNENTKKILDNTVKEVIDNLANTIHKGMTDYVIQNVFCNQRMVEDTIHSVINQYYYRN